MDALFYRKDSSLRDLYISCAWEGFAKHLLTSVVPYCESVHEHNMMILANRQWFSCNRKGSKKLFHKTKLKLLRSIFPLVPELGCLSYVLMGQKEDLFTYVSKQYLCKFVGSIATGKFWIENKFFHSSVISLTAYCFHTSEGRKVSLEYRH